MTDRGIWKEGRRRHQSCLKNKPSVLWAGVGVWDDKHRQLKAVTVSIRGWDVAQLVEHRTATPLRQVQFLSVAMDFSSGINFHRRLSYSACMPLCATSCINIFAHIKGPVVHVRVQWIMETLKHSACSVGWAAWLCHSWLSLGKATWIFHGWNPNGTIQF